MSMYSPTYAHKLYGQDRGFLDTVVAGSACSGLLHTAGIMPTTRARGAASSQTDLMARRFGEPFGGAERKAPASSCSRTEFRHVVCLYMACVCLFVMCYACKFVFVYLFFTKFMQTREAAFRPRSGDGWLNSNNMIINSNKYVCVYIYI